MPESKKRTASYLGALSIICGILAAGILFEVVLQITDPTRYDIYTNDPSTGLLLYKPNISFTAQSQCYSNVVQTNSEGFNAPEFPPAVKSPHEYRIEIVSASFVDAEQIPLSQRMAYELQQKLNAKPNQPYTYTVVPIAFGGSGTFLDILYYLRFGQALHPDLVIYLTTENISTVDATGNSGQYDVRFDSQGNLITTLPNSYKNSRLGSVIPILLKSKFTMSVLEKLQGYVGTANLDSQKYILPIQDRLTNTKSPSISLSDEWKIEGRLYDTFASDVKKTPAKFMVTSWATGFGTQTQAEAMHDNLTQLSTKDGFSYFDLAPAIAEQASSTGVSPVWSCDNHWSPAGDAYAAQGLYEYLESHPALLGQ